MQIHSKAETLLKVSPYLLKSNFFFFEGGGGGGGGGIRLHLLIG